MSSISDEWRSEPVWLNLYEHELDTIRDTLYEHALRLRRRAQRCTANGEKENMLTLQAAWCETLAGELPDRIAENEPGLYQAWADGEEC